MELTTANIRKMLRKEAMVKWLEDQPEDARFAPDSPCACMYHDMICDVFDVSYAYPTYTSIEAGEEVVIVKINGNSFAQKFQIEAARFSWKQDLNDVYVPRRHGCRTISRDEAIEIAKGI
jgi:hypothetical protein